MSEENKDMNLEENKEMGTEEYKEYPTFTVIASDQTEVELAVIDEFEFEKKEYVVAARIVDDVIDDSGVFIYRIKVGEEDFAVEKIVDPQEYKKVVKAYSEL